jgi:hypothetical protein
MYESYIHVYKAYFLVRSLFAENHVKSLVGVVMKSSVRVRCLDPRKKCGGHGWDFRGSGKARCPVCHSSQNSYNRRKFGRFKVSDLLTRPTKDANHA